MSCESAAAIRLGLLVVNAMTIVLVFLLGRRVGGEPTALSSAACFAVLSLGHPVHGFIANAEHFLLLPVAAGMLCLVRSEDEDSNRGVFVGGVLLGIALLIKHHAYAFVLAGALQVVLATRGGARRRIRRLLLFGAGPALLVAATLTGLYSVGTFDKFWFWNVSYLGEYGSQLSWSHGAQALRRTGIPVLRAGWPVYALALCGLVAAWRVRAVKRRRPFLLLLAGGSLAAIVPGLYFREHYFLLLLPAAALLAGVGVGAIARLTGTAPRVFVRRGVPALALVGAIGVCVHAERAFLFELTPTEVSRRLYGVNPFPESARIADWIRLNTDEGERIAVLGSEPQIPFLSGRRSATGFIYMYEMMREHQFAVDMQQEMIREIEEHRPEYLVMVNVWQSWLPRSDSSRIIFEWYQRYAGEHYALEGIVDIAWPSGESQFRMGPRLGTPAPTTAVWVSLVRRRSDAP